MTPLVYCDTRFWEVFDETGKSLGLHLYGDMITKYSVCGRGVLGQAFEWLKHTGYTYTLIGDIFPLSEDSVYPEIQAIKIKERQKERKREKKRAIKKGYQLESKIRFGKHAGLTIKQIIDNQRSYYQWLLKVEAILLHPECNRYFEEVNQRLNQ